MLGLLLHAQGSQLAVSLFLLYSPPERNWCSMTYLETASRPLIEAHQLARLRQGLVHMLPTNPFYQQKLAGTEHLSLKKGADLALLPFTAKQELVTDQKIHPLFGSNLTW